ncbi:MmgE/PrpD family protein [Thalassovita gelatinovora]|uniref:MmgE/PrpD family protein n=1 Tax=Thalassovita gelatinovora TaxID=53501 RepID=A0A0P1F6T1_THAGE|nr:MmgE/PrpD family protein [Thalassovita gelatinovora]QIZ81001.1 MmgE/PrpD family protein [Thalassovita gelatinovora]CUH63549.1 MmgE/PrpD family protein [Thalassovita gelatinovora]SEQ69097.1 2-methylcitrate dehydratase PrpD [Thalassovita gelatinovora]
MTVMDQILDLSEMPGSDITEEVRRLAYASLFDWLACGRAGIGEPVATKLRSFADHEARSGTSSVFGGVQVPARMAALVNGATSHALDFDDTHFDHVGHLSVGIFPAALAVGEETGASVRDVADSFLIGAEAAIRLGRILGAAHYNRGFHQTATAGAFGATLAAGRLYRLSRVQMRAAMGLCATRASGLKSQFGTMGKPYNAGLAASNGVECALLAGLGVTSADDGIMGPQGFIATHSDAPDRDTGWQTSPPQQFRFVRNSYKFHACCHGTHAMIEALLAARQTHDIDPDQVTCLRVRVNPRWLSVCDIKTPRTGLEVKFSYAWLAGMIFYGHATGHDRTYADALCTDPLLQDFAGKVIVTSDPSLSDQQTQVLIELTKGADIQVSHDLADRMPIETLEMRLAQKARSLIGDGAEDLIALRDGFDRIDATTVGTFVKAKQQ